MKEFASTGSTLKNDLFFKHENNLRKLESTALTLVFQVDI